MFKRQSTSLIGESSVDLISDSEMLRYFRRDQDDDDEDKKELRDAIEDAISYIETVSYKSLFQKQIVLYYDYIEVGERIPFAPLDIVQLVKNNYSAEPEDLSITEHFGNSKYPKAKLETEDVTVSVITASAREVDPSLKSLVKEVASYLLDHKGSGELSNELHSKVQRQQEILWF